MELGLAPQAFQFSVGMSQFVLVCARAVSLWLTIAAPPPFLQAVTMRSNDAKHHGETGAMDPRLFKVGGAAQEGVFSRVALLSRGD